MIETRTKILEYVWIGGKNELRSKTRVITSDLKIDPNHIPEWSYDGSSTWQTENEGNTEIILKPCAVFKDPLRNIKNGKCYIVLCDTYYLDGKPTPTNHRHSAEKVFKERLELEPWFGLEQEYFIIFPHQQDIRLTIPGYHYCGTNINNYERFIAEEHFKSCIEVGICISGINAEVSKCQWEFQIGPCQDITAGDNLIIARYLLERIAEKNGAVIDYSPKPNKNINGSGCHINFSTNSTRKKDGIHKINTYIERLKNKHSEHIKVYGEDNQLRLTGKHETSSYDFFSWGIGTRNNSIRIPNHVASLGFGYLEDRRPASNIDPYLTTSILFTTCCFQDIETKKI